MLEEQKTMAEIIKHEKEGILTYLAREEYLKNLIVDFRGKKISMAELPEMYAYRIIKKRELEEIELRLADESYIVEEALYFLKKTSHKYITGSKLNKQELIESIVNRLELGWKKDELEVEVANMPFLNDVYIHPENYINNPKSKIKPKDYKFN